MKTISSGLSEALLGGVYEIPLWAGFIRCLKDAVGADHVVFAFRPPMRPTREWIILLSDHANLANFRESYDSFYPPDWLPPGIDLPEGRSHSLSAALASEGEETRQRHIDFLKLSGISAGRQMRVREPSGVEAWISVARHHGDFSAEHDMVLDDLAPILRGVLRLYATIERERFAALVSGDAIRRLHFGWVALDSDGCIVGSDEQAEQLLASSGVLRRGPSDKLVSDRLETGREIAATIQRFTRDRETSARALSISHDPLLEMLLLPINRTTIAIRKPAVAVAYLHGDNWGGATAGGGSPNCSACCHAKPSSLSP